MNLRTIVIIALLALWPAKTIANGSGPPGHFEILFMGNSHSSLNDLPGLVRKLIEQGVPGADVQTGLAPGYYFLADRINDSASNEIFDSRPWTHVVLQAQKYSSSGFFTYPTLAAEEWIRRTRAKDGLPVMFPEWPRLGNDEEGPRVHRLHLEIAQREPACVAPVGLAWEEFMDNHPGIGLHAGDGNHSNPAGALLTAYVLYEVITGLPASALADQGNLGVEVSLQEPLREVASQVVQENQARCSTVNLDTDQSAVDFGQWIDTVAPAATVELVNNGLVDMQVTSIEGLTGPFNLAGGNCGIAPFALAARSSCSLEVGFHSAIDGLFEGELEIWAQEVVEPLRVTLRGIQGENVPLLKPGHSAAFFDAQRDGEGQLVEMLDANRAIVYTFTHRPDGSGPMWFIGAGRVEAGSIVIDELLRPLGTRFGESFNAMEVSNTPVGDLRMTFEDCESDLTGVTVSFSGETTAGIDALMANAGRLSNVMGCGLITPHPNAGLSGSYYQPERNGEGIVVQWLPDGQVLLYFFTHDLDDNQQWIIGIGQSEGTSVTMDALYPSGNTVWGPGFDPDEVVLSPWGTIGLAWSDCGSLMFSYESVVDGYGSATREYVRLSELWDTDCPVFN